VTGVTLDRIAPTTARLSWAAVINSTGYSISRGNMELLGANQLGSCIVLGHPNTEFDDSVLPPGVGFFYLIQAEGCGTGPLGVGFGGLQRVNNDPGACP